MNTHLRFITVALLVFITVALSHTSAHVTSQSNKRAADALDARFNHLRRGINTSHWFAQVPKEVGYTPARFDSFTTADDIALIKRMGFDHIRLSVEVAPMFNEADPSQLPADYLGHLDRAVDMILKRDLAVIVDLHPADEFKVRLNKDDKHVEAFARFWRALAAHLAKTDPERVFLEVLNEPMVEDAYRWWGIQARVIAAMREGAPRHTIIATAHRWSGLNEIIQLEPVADPNVIYNFHFYEPFPLTHQGATWAGPSVVHLKDVPYPSSSEAVAPVIAALDDDNAKRLLTRYGNEQWNRARIDAEIAKVAAWAARHNVRVTCNEFGVYRKFAPPTARATWLRDVRVTLEKYNMGWAMWDYQGGFAVVNKMDGKATPDPLTVKALGLSSAALHHGN
jgi:endoglucanase